MTLRPRFVHFLLIVACGCAALATSPFVKSQSPTTTTPGEQEARATAQSPADASPGFGDNPEERRMAYSGFLLLVGPREQILQGNTGEGDSKPSPRLSWTRILAVREDEEQAIRMIAGDAWSRIKEIDDRGRKEAEEYREDPTEEHREALYADGKEVGRKRTEILDETIARLRQELGEEDFKKLDAWVYRVCGYHPKPSPAKPADGGETKHPTPI